MGDSRGSFISQRFTRVSVLNLKWICTSSKMISTTCDMILECWLNVELFLECAVLLPQRMQADLQARSVMF